MSHEYQKLLKTFIFKTVVDKRFLFYPNPWKVNTNAYLSFSLKNEGNSGKSVQ